MIYYRFVSEYWTDGHSFRRPQDIIIEAREIESFFDEHIDRYPYLTFKVTTLMDEDEWTRRNSRDYYNIISNALVKLGSDVRPTLRRTVSQNLPHDPRDGP